MDDATLARFAEIAAAAFAYDGDGTLFLAAFPPCRSLRDVAKEDDRLLKSIAPVLFFDRLLCEVERSALPKARNAQYVRVVRLERNRLTQLYVGNKEARNE